MNDKTEKLMRLVDTAAQEDVVKADKDLYGAMMKAYKDLSEDKNIVSVSGKLSSQINRYLLTHQYKAPKSVVELGQKLQKPIADRWGHVNPMNLG
ncbi:hypothetical protein FD33_GL001265 [Companilactobacillus paralimentarius DSM 13238 = JCM 10415]|jgi:Enterocin A Immunity.|uniref:Prebacteriocin n=1 Tax=Companilactobacillus paralimentarius DSM 13238 = JCM 10415 TaxID=1122151 RepID=A0A0R1PI00_9LACO|nr:bacteriocin immunity protein [Companilactobacillus paralimentarius]KAE9564481.1 hypothetical protein ATN96_08340 [Companilactobacillus paralimentarius]KRL31990.1 hypothetical protein FD33_GL001265 [Companilactobacillus paralimentarius DSM 13238 = JCM 10415]MDR4932719.1 bacteriocin immunity protein [Companilactobacillus paralimentarius]QFR69279.1 hypothetical protein LP238_05290 [Companilactobacillus paralimentarius]